MRRDFVGLAKKIVAFWRGIEARRGYQLFFFGLLSLFLRISKMALMSLSCLTELIALKIIGKMTLQYSHFALLKYLSLLYYDTHS